MSNRGRMFGALVLALTLSGAAHAQQKTTPKKYAPPTTAEKERRCLGGDSYDCIFAGSDHEHGRGVPVNFTQAVRFYRVACDRSVADRARGFAGGQLPEQCYNLAVMTRDGRGLTADAAEGRRLLQYACRGAATLAAMACWDHAALQLRGIGGPADRNGAIASLRDVIARDRNSDLAARARTALQRLGVTP